MHTSLTSLKIIISKTPENNFDFLPFSRASLHHKRKRFRLPSAEIEYRIEVLEYKWL